MAALNLLPRPNLIPQDTFNPSPPPSNETSMTLVSNRSANMSSGLLLDPLPSPSSEAAPSGTRYKPFTTPNHHVTKGRYITSNDPRGYIPVYEYPLNGQWIMLDMDDGYVLWTGIWKALGNSKADIVKMVESQPDLAPQLRRVRGGYLKIQGTWMPYEIALRLARRVSWPIRYELVPLFGPTFPESCLSPDQPGFGQIVKPGTGKRRTRRTIPAGSSSDAKHDWTVISPAPHSTISGAGSYAAAGRALPHDLSHHQPRRHSDTDGRRRGIQEQDVGSPIALHSPYEQPFHRPKTASTSYSHSDTNVSPVFSTSVPTGRYSPYPNMHVTRPRTFSIRGEHHYSLPSPPHSRHSEPRCSYAYGSPDDFKLPPIKPLNEQGKAGRNAPLVLPPISSLDMKSCDDSTAVLRRLQSSSDDMPVVRVNIPKAHEPSPEYQQYSPSTSSNLGSGSQNIGARLPALRLPANPHPDPNSPPLTVPFSHQSESSSKSHSPVSPLLRTPHSAGSSRDDDIRGTYHSPIRERGVLPAPKSEDKPYALYHNRMDHRSPIGETIHCSGDDLPPYPTRHAWRPW